MSRMLVLISGIIFLKYSYAGVSYQHLMRKHRKSLRRKRKHRNQEENLLDQNIKNNIYSMI